MAIRMNGSGEVMINEYGEEMRESIEEGMTYGDFEEEYGDFSAYFLAVESPDSIIREEDETVYVGEMGIAAASEGVEMIKEIFEPDTKTKAAAAGGGVASLLMGLQFLRSGEPAWLASSLVTADLSKDTIRRAYAERNAYHEFQEDQDEAVDALKDAVDGIEDYDLEINDEQLGVQIADSVEEVVSQSQFPMPQELETGQAFQ